MINLFNDTDTKIRPMKRLLYVIVLAKKIKTSLVSKEVTDN